LTFAPGSAKAEKELIEKGAEKCLQKIEKQGGTYKLIDPKTGKVMYVGRTSDLSSRAKQHKRPLKTRELDFEVDKQTNIYDQLRGREQIIKEKYKPPLNKINPISPRNKNRQKYLDAAKELE